MVLKGCVFSVLQELDIPVDTIPVSYSKSWPLFYLLMGRVRAGCCGYHGGGKNVCLFVVWFELGVVR
jgi:hypothetical protein